MSRRGAGRFLVLEGIDGAGTTTQLSRLADALRQEGYRVLTTREPSDGPVGLLIRQALTHRLTGPGGSALPEELLALLFASDRMDHLTSVIDPALATGAVVLSDRYVLSSFAYQGLQLPLSWIEALNSRARRPDLTLYLEVDSRTARARRGARGGKPELFEGDQFQEKVAASYRRLLRKHGRSQRVVRVDGGRPPEQVTSQLLRAARAVLPRRRRR
jgi:dTMP kinase